MRCVYATDHWGIHDERWMAALTAVGFTPVAVSRDHGDPNDFRAKVEAASWDGGDWSPILAGPLHSVTQTLVGTSSRLVGLSWGYDIPALPDLHWLTRLDGLIIDSHANTETVMDAGVKADVITFLPWGVDLEMFSSHGPRATFSNIPEEATILLSLRAHEPSYRVGDIIDAFAILAFQAHDLHLVVGHSGSLTSSLKSQAKDLGIRDRVHFIGTVTESDIAELMRRSRCYVSASEVDGTSVTLLQAMSCGTPVVVSDIGGNRGWVTEGVTGHLFRCANVEHLAEALLRSLADSSTTMAARVLVEREADWHANIARLRPALTGS
jgi:glycosyltransferase involved in cell wall biosynthesis